MFKGIIKRVGKWNKAQEFVMCLDKEMEQARRLSILRMGDKTKKIVIGHIKKQDLGWKKLVGYTAWFKASKGYDPRILIRTGFYMSNIIARYRKEGVMVTVNDVKTEDGESLAAVALKHEHGVKHMNLPARPLWGPSVKEAYEWHLKENQPEQIFLRKMRRRGFV